MLTLLAQVNVSVDSLSMTTYWGIELANINRPPRFEHGRQFWVYWLGGHGWESGWRLAIGAAAKPGPTLQYTHTYIYIYIHSSFTLLKHHASPAVAILAQIQDFANSVHGPKVDLAGDSACRGDRWPQDQCKHRGYFTSSAQVAHRLRPNGSTGTFDYWLDEGASCTFN